MKVAILDNVHPLFQQTFNNWGWESVLANKWSQNDFQKNIFKFDGIVIRSRLVLDKLNLSFAKNLKFIARPGSGLENIDLDYCNLNMIKVFRSPEGNRDAVAEHVIGMVLMLNKHLFRSNYEVRKSIWNRESNRGSEIMGKTFAIIGYGYMGEALAKRLSGFGVNVIAYDKYKNDYSSSLTKQVTMDEVFKTADFVSLHTPLTSETIGMVNNGFISKFRKPFVLINSARGKSVVLKDLVEGLKSGKIAGACLDVLDIESSSFEKVEVSKNEYFDSLINMDNVVLSPHIAGWSHESKLKMAEFLIYKIAKDFLN